MLAVEARARKLEEEAENLRAQFQDTVRMVGATPAAMSAPLNHFISTQTDTLAKKS